MSNGNHPRAQVPEMTLEGLFRRLYEQTPPGQHPVLPIGRLQLHSHVHTRGGRVLLARDGQDVPFVRGSISASQIEQHRPSYINALLIQSQGVTLAQPCRECCLGRGLRPFTECRHVPGVFSGACANCKWPDGAINCSVRDENWTELVEEQRSPNPQRVGRGQGLLPAAGEASRPINLDPEDGDDRTNPINLDPEEGEQDNPIIL